MLTKKNYVTQNHLQHCTALQIFVGLYEKKPNAAAQMQTLAICMMPNT